MAPKLVKGVGNVLRDYSGWTATHGVPHIGSAQNMGLRIFWSLVFVVSLCILGWQISGLVAQYLAYDVNVETEVLCFLFPSLQMVIDHICSCYSRSACFRP
jgi:hypothetical protein